MDHLEPVAPLEPAIAAAPSIPAPPAPPGVTVADIYYTLFRHKWKIIICALLGLGAAAGFLKLKKPTYQSEARLFIRYVITDDGKTAGPGHDESITKSTDPRGESIIATELEILSSWDLAMEVATNVGAEKILGKGSKPTDLFAAAGMVSNGLTAEVPSGSVVRLTFRHPEPEVAQLVLKELVECYLKRHAEIHRTVGGDFLTQETDQLRSRLSQTEEDLRKKISSLNIISLDDFKKTSSDQLAKLRAEIFDLRAELAERQSIFQEMTKQSVPNKSATEPGPAPVPNDQVDAYQKISAHVLSLRQREQELLNQFTDENPRVKDLRTALHEAEEDKNKLLASYPGLSQVRTVNSGGSGGSASGDYNAVGEAAKINALQVKLKVLSSQIDEVRAEAAKVDQQEISILELRRRRDLEDANYRYYQQLLEQTRINEALGTNRLSNIVKIQAPTPPAKDMSGIYKMAVQIAGAGIGAGFAWAFLIELFLDRSVRRPAHVEQLLHLPLFISLPRIGRKQLRALGAPDPEEAAAEPEAEAEAEPMEGLPEPATTTAQELPAMAPEAALAPSLEEALPSGQNLLLAPYFHTLRDRLISYFDNLNVRHKPKLVAVTGMGKHGGVTTVATGLARSFSETGEGRVLLVDMTQGQGSSRLFHQGRTVGDLDQLLEGGDSTQVQNNLFVVAEDSSSERLAKGLPQRFNQLVPKLKASDFDYIIFDMPAVNQISITPRLASFMDMVLLVIESEKVDRDIVLQATALLARSKTPLGVVLNKAKTYIPKFLHQDHDYLIGA